MNPRKTRMTLLERIRAGDEHGWLEFYELYRPLILWLCRRQGVQSGEIRQMLVQAVMCHFASQAWQHDPEKGQFRSFLLRVATLKLHEVLREVQPLQSRQIKGRDAVDALPADIPWDKMSAQEPSSSTDEERESLDRALEILMADESVDPRHLQVLMLSLEGLNLATISERTRLTIVNTKVIRHRLLQRLRGIVAEHGL